MTRNRIGIPAAALLAAGVACAGPAPAAAQTLPPQEYQELARSIFSELIEINATDSRGDNTAAARAMARRLLDAGFPAEDVHVLVPADAPRKGNLVARYRGRDGNWYGRGVTDDKDEAAIYTANLIRMRREGFIPDRDIILALTADEEGGPRNGVEFLLAEHRDLIGDAGFALNEGGGGMEKDGRKISNNVQASEKKFLSFQLEATNPGGHSSLPVKKNAIYDLSQALLAVQAFDFPVLLNPVTEAFFSRSADLVAGGMGRAMSRIVADPGDAAAAATLSAEPGYNSRLRTTCVATMLQGGHAQNALPQMARATVNCRILPDHDPEDVHRRLQELAEPFEVSVTPTAEATPSPPSPLTEEVLGPIERITQEMWPGVKVLPVMSTGATDGLYLRREGIPVYGVSGIFGDMDDVRAHGRDERIRVSAFHEGQEFLYRLVKALTGGGVA